MKSFKQQPLFTERIKYRLKNANEGDVKKVWRYQSVLGELLTERAREAAHAGGDAEQGGGDGEQREGDGEQRDGQAPGVC